MSQQLSTAIAWFLLACGAAGSFYLIAATFAVRRFLKQPVPRTGKMPPVTVLKPLCGDEPELYENLKSYCLQSYPVAQLVFGVQDPQDPAIETVRRLQRQFPSADIGLVVERGRRTGNLKIANLQNMLPRARHDVLIIADADIRVPADHISSLVSTLFEPGVGLVTCLYRARPVAGFWSRLGALHIDHAFLPQAVMGEALGAGYGCFGATIALRKSTLHQIGGFASVADRLADDHALGEAVRGLGLLVRLSPELVDNVVYESSLASLFRHELRWARTIRTVAPTGFTGSLITHPLVLTILGNVLEGWSVAGTALLAWVFLCRASLAWAADAAIKVPRSPLWLVPVRDVLSFAVFLASFLTRTVAWRDQRIRIGPGGQLIHSRR